MATRVERIDPQQAYAHVESDAETLSVVGAPR
jgi:hypothetical protein